MSVACPNGHLSETVDYCDQCGARIEGMAGPPPAAAAPPPATEAPAGVGEPCPLCHTPRVGEDRFCEGCGYDYTAPAPRPGLPTTIMGPASAPGPAPAWEAVAIADREYFDRVAPEGVPFPLHCPPRTYLLSGDQIRVGRYSNSRGIQPEVDLTGAPEDSAISHLHCILIEQPDGSYSVVDPGSTNGTTVNDDPTPLMANTAVALADGDRIHLGAWTTITIRALRSTPAGTTTP
jgi:FHA domain